VAAPNQRSSAATGEAGGLALDDLNSNPAQSQFTGNINPVGPAPTTITAVSTGVT
jgi:hypothetical protein